MRHDIDNVMALRIAQRKTSVVKAELGDFAGLIGAALLLR
jgi:hypothetical protein